ncbi:hypothetical protein L3Q65_08560 [Amycolatopsis sp. FU40]|uniref:hypothetical protein n=1 Tax=Amycolatopsis sp. FU40 TaxID=2914159 RepID=UPI001F3CE1C5|nr:hypothetical protein [Amycolatopsis sp. FU40]UKD56756.1 hypothetical protein L3Q65_08560 [Amycolatopsis sp. FU40]
MKGFTTPDKPVDIAQVFPELAGLERTTVRLHPRQDAVTVRDSSLGGPLLWPAEEAWPVCTVDHPDERPLTSPEGKRLQRRREEILEEKRNYEYTGPHPLDGEYAELETSIRELRRAEFADDPAASLPMAPIAQFYARDIPELPFPDGTDVCQVLWCPTDHEPHYGPRPLVRWRNSADVTEIRAATEPDREFSDEESLPSPCRIWPERVTEYPHADDLPSAELRARIAEWEKGTEWTYYEHLSAAPGSKVGGWISWVQYPHWPECGRGHRMDHLLTVSSTESGGWQSWMPLEEQATTTFVKQVWYQLVDGGSSGTTIGLDEEFDATEMTYWGAVAPETVRERVVPEDRSGSGRLDLMLGDVGDVYVFVCAVCPDRPVGVEFQCC